MTDTQVRNLLRGHHVKQVQSGEKRIAQQFTRITQRMLHTAATAARDGAHSIDIMFSLAELFNELLYSMRSPVALVMLDSAEAELQHIERATKKAPSAVALRPRRRTLPSLEIEVPAGISIGEYPPWLLVEIRRALDESFEQDYWLGMLETTNHDIRDAINVGVTEGHSTRRIASTLEGMRSHYTRARALRVARTETTRAANAGHESAVRGTAQETGLPLGKEWLSVLGNTTRQSHADMDGETVPADGNFILSGYAVPYPCHHNLPPGESVNCQCSVISSIIV